MYAHNTTAYFAAIFTVHTCQNVLACPNNLNKSHLCLNCQGYMDLPPSELNDLVKKQEDILAAAQKDGRSANCFPIPETSRG